MRAFATYASFGERLCIKHKCLFTIKFSSRYLINCDPRNLGCDGGNRYEAWSYLIRKGNISEEFVPYKSNFGVVERWMKQCTKYPELTFQPLKARDDMSIRTYSNQIEKTKLDLMENGPIIAGMITYNDMYLYKGDLYYSGPRAVQADRHAVNLVGWGVSPRGIEYWIVQNSWGPEWGENGYFKLTMKMLDISKMVITGDV